MTARAVISTATEWDVVRSAWYIATPDDFSGCGLIFNPDNGQTWAIGKNRLGSTVKLRLYTPLCNHCDEPIPDSGLCEGCCLIHADIPEVRV